MLATALAAITAFEMKAGFKNHETLFVQIKVRRVGLKGNTFINNFVIRILFQNKNQLCRRR
jgi:hypothetical protein